MEEGIEKEKKKEIEAHRRIIDEQQRAHERLMKDRERRNKSY